MAREGSSGEATGAAGKSKGSLDLAPLEKGAARARAAAKEVGEAIKDGFGPVTDKVGSAVRTGIGSVEEALEDPTEALGDALLGQTDLPEIEGEDALSSILLRLDREADLFRGLGMQRLTRAAWMDRLSVAGTALGLIGVGVIAAIAGFRGLFAGESPVIGAAILLGTGALVLLAGTIATSRAAARLRDSQIELAQNALARADRAERRLQHVAMLMEMRHADRRAYLDALQSVEASLREP
ncbi:MAG: hypothetical protein U0359_15270 [Byssovorax sp.]